MSHASRIPGSCFALALALAAGLAVASGAGPVSAQEPTTPAATQEPTAPATPAATQEPRAAGAPANLDRLLKLPTGQEYGVERRGGLSRGEWRGRFAELRAALTKEEQGLAEAQTQLDEVAGDRSNWQMAPIPGFEPSPDAPLDYQLRMRIRRHRSEIDRLRSRLTELEIEANLAGVPEEWRS